MVASVKDSSPLHFGERTEVTRNVVTLSNSSREVDVASSVALVPDGFTSSSISVSRASVLASSPVRSGDVTSIKLSNVRVLVMTVGLNTESSLGAHEEASGDHLPDSLVPSSSDLSANQVSAPYSHSASVSYQLAAVSTHSMIGVIAEAVLDDTSDWVTEGSVVAVLPSSGVPVRESATGTIPDSTIAVAPSSIASSPLTTALSPVESGPTRSSGSASN